jgi:hypothetical protein
MRLFLPDNIFSRLYANNLPEALKSRISYLPSSVIPSELKKNENSAGLITPMDLITSPELSISSKTGISFEGLLSNSYIYFHPGQKDFNAISLFGDISSLEIILSKIFFKENYNTDIQIELLSDFSKAEGKNLLVTGDLNFTSLNFNNGLSFAEEIIDMLSLPYVNFILASYTPKVIEEMNNVSRGIAARIYDSVETGSYGDHIPPDAVEYIKENIASLIYEFEVQDIDDIHQLTRLPYFYGMVTEIIDLKFV